MRGLKPGSTLQFNSIQFNSIQLDGKDSGHGLGAGEGVTSYQGVRGDVRFVRSDPTLGR